MDEQFYNALIGIPVAGTEVISVLGVSGHLFYLQVHSQDFITVDDASLFCFYHYMLGWDSCCQLD